MRPRLINTTIKIIDRTDRRVSSIDLAHDLCVFFFFLGVLADDTHKLSFLDLPFGPSRGDGRQITAGDEQYF